MEKQGNKLIIVLLIFSIALNIGVFGVLIYQFTKKPSPFREFSPPQDEKRILTDKRLPVDENTRKEIDEEKKEFRDYVRKRYMRVRELRREYAMFIIKGDFDNARKTIEEINKIRLEIDIKVLEHFKKILQNLPEDKRRIVFMRLVRILRSGSFLHHHHEIKNKLDKGGVR